MDVPLPVLENHTDIWASKSIGIYMVTSDEPNSWNYDDVDVGVTDDYDGYEDDDDDQNNGDDDDGDCDHVDTDTVVDVFVYFLLRLRLLLVCCSGLCGVRHEVFIVAASVCRLI